MEELELESEKYLESKKWIEGKPENWVQNTFKSGASSKFVEKQKLRFSINQLNKLDSILQSKLETLKETLVLYEGSSDIRNFNYIHARIGGIRFAKEEIRREINELEQELSVL